MGANIELWKYRSFSNNSLYLEEVFHPSRSTASSAPVLVTGNGYKNPIMVEAGKKAALTRATAIYTFDENLEGKSNEIQELTESIREFILGLDEAIDEVPRKSYIAYKISQNIACMEIQRKNIKLVLKLEPSDIPDETPNYRDVTSIGHYGTGKVEFTVSTESEFDPVKEFIVMAYNKVGG